MFTKQQLVEGLVASAPVPMIALVHIHMINVTFVGEMTATVVVRVAHVANRKMCAAFVVVTAATAVARVAHVANRWTCVVFVADLA